MDLIYQIIIIAFIHWVGDFLLQITPMAEKKSTSFFWLFNHIAVYSLVWLLVGIFIFDWWSVYVFTFVTFVTHFIVDYFTSRWTKKLREQEKYYGFPAFFSVIGLDQFLHIAQLLLTYKFVIL